MQTSKSPNDSDAIRTAREVHLVANNGGLAAVFIHRAQAAFLADCAQTGSSSEDYEEREEAAGLSGRVG